MDANRSVESGDRYASSATGSNSAIKDTVAGVGRDLREAATKQGVEALGILKGGADEALADAGEKAAARVDEVAGTAHELGRRLDRHGQAKLGRFAEEAATSISAVSERLRGGSIDQLVDDAHRLARSNPGLFVLGSVAIGFGLARFLKASDEEQPAGDGDPMTGANPSTRPSSSLSQGYGGAHGY